MTFSRLRKGAFCIILKPRLNGKPRVVHLYCQPMAYYYAMAEDYLTQYRNMSAQYTVKIETLQKELGELFSRIASAQAAGENAVALEASARQKQQEISDSETGQLVALTNLEATTISGIEASILTYQQNLLTSR